MSRQDRNIFNSFLVSRFQSLRYMYQQSAEEEKKDRLEKLNKEWMEWENLEPESREYVLKYLSKKEE